MGFFFPMCISEIQNDIASDTGGTGVPSIDLDIGDGAENDIANHKE